MNRSPRPVRVLLSTSAPDGTTRYVDQVVKYPGEVQHLYFSWRRALLGRYEVFHVHWPESLVRSRSSVLRLARRIATLLFLARLRIVGTPVVRTVHNSTPHSPGDHVENWLVGALDRLVSGYICLNELTVTRPGIPRFLIPLGSYHEPFAGYPRGATRAGMLFFGRIDAYKGVDELVRAFSQIEDPRISLRIVGQPHGDVSEIVAAAAADQRITTEFSFVPDAQLVVEVTSAELAVLPYRHLENSAVVLVALSLATPVLAPHTPTAELLQDEFGTDWVRLYRGVLDASVLEQANEWARGPRGVPPSMAGRTWPEVGAAHSAAYRSLTEGPRS